MSNKLITIKIGGEAGFGIKVAGATLGKVFLRLGYEIADYTEYPSLIRGGHNTTELTIGPKIYHVVRPINLLVALNQETFDKHLSILSDDAGIIFDPEKTKPTTDKFKLYPVPFGKILKEIAGSDLMKNTVALGATLAVLDGNIEGYLQVLKEIFGKKSDKIVNANIAAANAGYSFVKENLQGEFPYKIEPQEVKDQVYLTGNEAIALGAIAGQCQAYFAYPMTPSTSVLVYLSKHGPKVGMLVRQAEDEISVINQAIGASWAGARSMLGTSGGGFALMSEALGLAGITETPLVIFVSQRSGPATGLPTWSEQGDLRFVLHTAQGEFPRIILAPGDQEECFYMTAEAHNLAQKYQMPVFILSDKNLSEGGKTVTSFDQSKIAIEHGEVLSEEQVKQAKKYLRYQVTESGVSPRTLPGTENGLFTANSDEHNEYGYSEEDGENRIAQVDKRARKLETVAKEIPKPVFYGPNNADLTIVSWGSTKSTILQAMESLKDKSVNFLHYSYMWPLGTAQFEPLKKAKKIMVIENNSTGLFEGIIRENVGRVSEFNFRKYDGRPFWPHEIVKKILNI